MAKRKRLSKPVKVGKRFKIEGRLFTKQEIKRDIRDATKLKKLNEDARHKKRLRNIKKEEQKTKRKFGLK